MENKDIMQVDVEAVIASKDPKLLKKIPRFIIRYLKRIVHQDDINEFLKLHGDKQGLDFVNAILTDFNIKIETFGEENIPQNGRFIFAANHPMGGLESNAFIKIVSKHYSEIKFPVNDIIMQLKPMHNILIPVNKHGIQHRDAVKQLEAEFAGDKQILYFPAGLVSRKIKGKITDLDWKKSFISKAKQHKRDIILVYIEGHNSTFFYNLANWRKRFGIKTNIEMLYLVNEAYKQYNKTIKLVFSKPISWQELNTKHSSLEWAELLKKECYNLASKID
jgi:1-acyl-sn-glycerol-3-phosphate acyltransferase